MDCRVKPGNDDLFSCANCAAQSGQPALQIRAHEGVIVEVRIGGADAVDLLLLSGAERLARIEAPDAFEQPLPAQDLVAAGDHAVEIVGGVEDRRVAVGGLRVQRQQVGRYFLLGNRGVNALEELDRALDPHAPMAEQPPLMRKVRSRPLAITVKGVTRSRTM